MSEQSPVLERPASSTDAWASVHLFFEGNIYTEKADQILRDVVSPLLQRPEIKEKITRWFFIRYNQGGSHLRLRLQGDAQAIEAEVMPFLGSESPVHSLLVRSDWVPYEPEFDRYGGLRGIDLAERIFQVSSEVALDLVRRLPEVDRSSRLGKAMLAMLVLIYVFASERRDAAAFAGSYGTNYLRTMVPDATQQERWMETFEKGFDRQADRLAAYVEAAWEALEDEDELTPELDRYRQGLRPLRDEFHHLQDEMAFEAHGRVFESLGESVGRIVPSYLHMMNNRLGVSIQEETYLSVLIRLTLEDQAPGP